MRRMRRMARHIDPYGTRDVTRDISLYLSKWKRRRGDLPTVGSRCAICLLYGLQFLRNEIWGHKLAGDPTSPRNLSWWVDRSVLGRRVKGVARRHSSIAIEG